MKHKWKVQEAPTGRYRSFHKRGWPGAYYKNDKESPCANIYCEDSYTPALAKSGNHAELKVTIADHSVTPWKWRTLKKRFSSIDEAKAAVTTFLETYPDFMPKE